MMWELLLTMQLDFSLAEHLGDIAMFRKKISAILLIAVLCGVLMGCTTNAQQESTGERIYSQSELGLLNAMLNVYVFTDEYRSNEDNPPIVSWGVGREELDIYIDEALQEKYDIPADELLAREEAKLRAIIADKLERVIDRSIFDPDALPIAFAWGRSAIPA